VSQTRWSKTFFCKALFKVLTEGRQGLIKKSETMLFDSGEQALVITPTVHTEIRVI
jgi:hypothetical protein